MQKLKLTRAVRLLYRDCADFNVGITWAAMNFPISSAIACTTFLASCSGSRLLSRDVKLTATVRDGRWPG